MSVIKAENLFNYKFDGLFIRYDVINSAFPIFNIDNFKSFYVFKAYNCLSFIVNYGYIAVSLNSYFVFCRIRVDFYGFSSGNIR